MGRESLEEKKQRIIDALKRFETMNGRAPRVEDFGPPEYPSAGTAIQLFGGWNNALAAAGINPRRKMGWTKEQCICAFRDYHDRTGVVPTALTYKTCRDVPSFRVVIPLFGSWNAGIEAAQLSARITSYTDDFLLSKLRRYFDVYDDLPRMQDLGADSDYPSYSSYHARWGGIAEAAVAAGIVPPEHLVLGKEGALAHARTLYAKQHRAPILAEFREALPKFSSLKEALSHFGGSYNQLLLDADLLPNRQNWTDTEILDAIKRLAKELGRTPNAHEFLGREGFPHPRTIRIRLGSYLKALKAAGLEITPDVRLWWRWQCLVCEIVEALYGEYIQNRTDLIDGLVDALVPSLGLVIDAMTTAYTGVHKRSQIERYTAPGTTLQFWCLAAGEEFKDGRVKYLYPDDIEQLIKRSDQIADERKLELVKKMHSMLNSRVGIFTRDYLIGVLLRLKLELGRQPKLSDLDTRKGYPSITPFNRVFGTFSKALAAAGMKPRWGIDEGHARSEAINVIRQLSNKLGATPSDSDCREHLGYSISRLYWRFGSTNDLYLAAGLPPNQIRKRRRSIELPELPDHSVAEQLAWSDILAPTAK